MRNVIYYISTSIDGHIARADGRVDWLFDSAGCGYEEFIGTVDTILMGRKTYDKVLTFGDWPYSDKDVYVFTSTKAGEHSDHAAFMSGSIPSFVKRLKSEPGKNIWLLGGAELASEFIKHDLIDVLWLFVHPVLLGEGIPLLPVPYPETWFTADSAKVCENGLVQMRYIRGRAVS